MAAAPPTDDALHELLENGSDEDVQGFLRLVPEEDLTALVKSLADVARRRVLRNLSTAQQIDVVESVSTEAAVDLLVSLDPAQAGDVLEQLDEDLRNVVFARLELADQAELLREIEDRGAREELIEAIPDADLADIVEQQRSDDATDLVDELDDERMQRVLGEMEADKRAEIEQLQSYPDDSAGGLMQTELIRLGADLTVGGAIEIVRTQYSSRMGDVYDLYVVDADNRILGRVRNRHLVLNKNRTPLSSIMKTDVLTVPVTMDQEEIANIVQDYDVATIAVVNERDQLVGRILVDDILDVFEEEATEDVAKMAGTGADDIYSRSVLLALRVRYPWLFATFAGGVGSVLLISSWEGELTEHIPLLAAVIPIIMGMAGNVGTQAATVTVRGIAVGEIDLTHLGRVVVKEFLTGLVFALCFSALLFPILFFVVIPATDPSMPPEFSVPMVLLVPSIAMCFTIAAGAAAGTLIPLVLQRLGKDPAVASAPFITTTIDLLAIGLLVLVKTLIL